MPKFRNIKLTLEYDGTTFFGFQRQPKRATIQEVLEKALSTILNQKTKIESASGRTDAGVHAEGQIVNFKTASAIDLFKLQRGLNSLLPQSIVIQSAEEVSESFHARYSAKSKVYEYSIWNHPNRSPLLVTRSWHIPHHLDIAKIRKALKFFIGRHDFTSFTSPAMINRGQKQSAKEKSCVRTIKAFRLKKNGFLLLFHVEADGFLYHMVRNMIGTLIEVGENKILPEDIPGIIEARDRKKAGKSAPSCGLILKKVIY